MHWNLIAVTTLATTAVLAAPRAASAQRQTNLSGRWVLKTEESPDTIPIDTLPPADSVGRDTIPADSMGTDFGARRPPEGGRSMRRRRLSEKDQRQVQLLLGMAQPVPAFTIAQTDSTLTITNEDGFSYTVYLDGRKTAIPLDDSVSVQARARWRDGALEIEYRPDGGGKMTETYQLADSRVYLRLEITVDYGRLPRPIWRPRMYRRDDGTGGP
jgi:hypothetical protein